MCGYFLQFKDKDAGGLSPGKDADAEMQKIASKDFAYFQVNRLYYRLETR